jgi:hypothetical protein
MVKIKFNDHEVKLLKRAFGWYLKNYADDDVKKILTKEDLNKADLEIIKDVLDEFHRKTGLGDERAHKIEAGIIKKLGNIKSTFEKQLEQEKKELEAHNKKIKQEQAKKEKELAKAKKDIEAKAKAELEAREKAKVEANKDQYTFKNIFNDLNDL